VKNIACEFGENQRLKGVLSWPTDERRDKMALILISAGFTAKMGPHRVYAELARSLAALGVATLRFDLGGIGNSQTLHPGQALEVRTKHDIQNAIAFLQEQHGIEKFVIGGLCSGAEDAFHYAAGDARVTGVLMIDPHAYKTRMWSIRNVASRRFLNRLIHKVLRVIGIIKVVRDENAVSDVEGLESSLINYCYTSHYESTRILKELITRDVHLHYVYTGGRAAVFNHKRQFLNMFKGVEFGRNLTLDYIPNIEHTQVFEEDRQELVTVISQRLSAIHS